jgi:PEP-CTERM motif-containing protein
MRFSNSKFGTFLLCGLAIVAAISLGAIQASAQAVFDFQDGTDQGFGTGFGDDASASFPIVNIGGSLRMEVMDTAAFQQAGRQTGNPADLQYIAMLAASAAEALYTISYDWYVDTSLAPGQYGNFMQLGTYVNTGSGYYAQNFGAVKEVELNGAQLASGQLFQGTVSQTFAAKGFDIPAAETFFRIGLIINGDGANAKVYFDNISIQPVPEPATLALLGLGGIGLVSLATRRRGAAK